MFCFAAVPEDPVRFPESFPDGDIYLLHFAAVPEDPGRFPEGYPEAKGNIVKNNNSPGRFPEEARNVTRKPLDIFFRFILVSVRKKSHRKATLGTSGRLLEISSNSAATPSL